MDEVLFHFSEDRTIERFHPHVPRTNPTQAPAVWAIDADHAPLYWFPRDCPRVAAWPRDETEAERFGEAFVTTARRIHTIELGWLDRMRTAELYCYRFDRSLFHSWADASGQWISESVVDPIDVHPVGDLLERHVDAGIELRVAPSLWPLHDLAREGPWDFSIVRMSNARPRD